MGLEAETPLLVFGVTLDNFIGAYDFLTANTSPNTSPNNLEELVRILDSIIMPKNALVWSAYYRNCQQPSLPRMKQLLDMEIKDYLPGDAFFVNDITEYRLIVKSIEESPGTRLIPFQLLSRSFHDELQIVGAGLHAVGLNPYEDIEEPDLEMIRRRQVKAIASDVKMGCGLLNCLTASSTNKLTHYKAYGTCNCYLASTNFSGGRLVSNGLHSPDGVDFWSNQARNLTKPIPDRDLDTPVFYKLTPKELDPKVRAWFRSYLKFLEGLSSTCYVKSIRDSVEGIIKLHLGFVLPPTSRIEYLLKYSQRLKDG